jgi:L-malate glycosyltransferase
MSDVTNKQNLVEQKHWDKIYQNLNFYKPASNDVFRTWINSYIPSTKNKDCIEIGCYPGRFLTIFGDLGYKLNGIDLTENLNILPQWLKSEGYSIGEIEKQDFFEMDTTINKYDLVSSFGFIEHFSNWVDVLINHAEMVKEDGYLVIETPNFSGEVIRLMRMLLDSKNYENHDKSAMYPKVWALILEKLDFEIIFSGYFGGFAFWVDETPSNNIKKQFIQLIQYSTEFFKKTDISEEKIAPYCGLIAKKRSNKEVKEIMKDREISDSIDELVMNTKQMDSNLEDKMKQIFPYFDEWCDFISNNNN